MFLSVIGFVFSGFITVTSSIDLLSASKYKGFRLLVQPDSMARDTVLISIEVNKRRQVTKAK